MLSLTLLGGCQHFGYHAKRQSELNCPTDIRQSVPWCAGEDAIFQCPCGPSSEFHGYKPTCWGIWPAPGAEWRDAHCGPLATDYACQNGGCQSESCPCELSDSGLNRLPSVSTETPFNGHAETPFNGHVEEIYLGSPADSEAELVPQPYEGQPVPDNSVPGNESPGDSRASDRTNQSTSIDYTLPHETQALQMQSVLNSLGHTNLETVSNSAVVESGAQKPAQSHQPQVPDVAAMSELDPKVDPQVGRASVANRLLPQRTKRPAAEPSILLESRQARTATTRTAAAKQKLETHAEAPEASSPQAVAQPASSFFRRLSPNFVR